ncbi:MAG TPA: 4Fe-4S binding protein [Candidatus Bathyarchaeia archaeon]|nr:4Fe-4S binding protein [Candidatus Bathyarchaeia archaeon]
MKRDIIHINEEKCTGCGTCVSGCPEGALQIIDQKARVVNELFCDGLGACIDKCPEGAIEIETREAEAYDEHKVIKNLVKAGPNVVKAHLLHLREHGQIELLNEAVDFLKENNLQMPDYQEALAGACPGSMTRDLRRPKNQIQSPVMLASELGNWPIQLRLLTPDAPYLKNANLLLAADCAPFAYANFHQRFLRDKILIIFCPKLDQDLEAYVEKLCEIFQKQDIKSISIVHMEVPCCSGIEAVVQKALGKARKNMIIKDYTIGITGEII